jgi:indolepyruvate ferredoxin oxidoreductase beta subunit
MAGVPAQRARITLAIAAMGGQGGGVLAEWIVAIAEQSGYFIQTTSVPGVAQRTGATIYYLELFPETPGARPPILGLMPIPGDVDIVVAAELAEAGRAVQRGIVTPDRTTLIASTHRAYAYAEKSALGDGRISEATTAAAIGDAAKTLICFDMQALAEAHGTVISAPLFGALAGSGALPFTRAQFEAAITGSGKAVEANLAAFATAYEHAADPATAQRNPSDEVAEAVPDSAAAAAAAPEIARLVRRIERDLAPAMADTARHGLRRTLDYQDAAYGTQYLDRLEHFSKHVEAAAPDHDHGRLLNAFARHLALWMTYEDTIRVADLKIRRSRFERCRDEVRAGDDEIVHLTEFMHPRIEEVADTLPAPLGRWLIGSEWTTNLLTRTVLRERKIHTSKLGGFCLMYGLSALRRFRRSSLRFVTEQQRIEDWLARIETLVASNYPAAIEVVLCQNLIKGYSDTHARGLANFNRIMESLDRAGLERIEADSVRDLRNAALADEHGDRLQAELARVA